MALMRRWLGKIFDGAGWSVGVAAALVLFALLGVGFVAQTPEVVLWTGQHAVGTEQNGLVLFRWQGRDYSVDMPGYGSSQAVSVYFEPGNPTDAMADNIGDRALAILLVAVPLLLAAAVLLAGLTRKRRWARQRSRAASAFGTGLDEDFVARQLQQRRGRQ